MIFDWVVLCSLYNQRTLKKRSYFFVSVFALLITNFSPVTFQITFHGNIKKSEDKNDLSSTLKKHQIQIITLILWDAFYYLRKRDKTMSIMKRATGDKKNIV